MGRYLLPSIRNKGRKDIEPDCLCGRGRKGTMWNTQLQRLMCFRCVIISAGFRGCCYSIHVVPLPRTTTRFLYSPSTKWDLNLPDKCLFGQTLHFLSS